MDIISKLERSNEMYLKRLEIQGFKSFADRTILEFQKVVE